MILFERGETTISIEKVLAILNVVNLEDKAQSTVNDQLGNFAGCANVRWFELTTQKPNKSSLAAKHSLGYVSYSFKINGQLKKIDNIAFRRILDDVARTKYSAWSPFG